MCPVLLVGITFSSPSDTVGGGDLTIGFVGGSSFTLAVDAADSLSDVRDAINNATDNNGVFASLLTVDAGMGDGSTVTELVLSSTNTGADNQLTVSILNGTEGTDIDNLGLSRLFFDGSLPDDSGNQMSNIQEAQDARITVDGFTAYSSTNDFDSVIDGVTITVESEAADELNPPSSSLNIAIDNTSIKADVEVFVASYNELVTILNSLTDYDAVSETRGLLGGDSSVSAIETQIRRIISAQVEGAAEYVSSLANLGITTNWTLD